MKKISIGILVFCLISLSCQTNSLQGTLTLYENEQEKIDGEKIIKRITVLVANDINAVDNNGYTSLMYASQYGYTKLVKSLIVAGADVNKIHNTVGSTALIIAANSKILDALLEAGATIESKDTLGMTALHWAAFRGQADAVKVLIKAGADIDSKTNANHTALRWAAFNEHSEIVRLLIKESERKRKEISKL